MALTNRLLSGVIADVIVVARNRWQQPLNVVFGEADTGAEVFNAGLRVRGSVSHVLAWLEPVSGTLDADLHGRARPARQRDRAAAGHVVDGVEVDEKVRHSSRTGSGDRRRQRVAPMCR